MVELSGPILGESFFNKEVGQALQLLDGMLFIWSLLIVRFEVRNRSVQWGTHSPPLCFESRCILLSACSARPGQDLDPSERFKGESTAMRELTMKAMVRERASLLLSACLKLVKDRERSATDVYRRIFEEAHSGLQKASSTESILGSLHAVGSMLDNQQLVRDCQVVSLIL
jgi:FKBP12-rapamycin complex-associated protein